MGLFGDIMMPFKGPGGYHNLRSLALNGIDQFAISANPYVFTPPFTVSAWIYITSGGGGLNTIVANHAGAWDTRLFSFQYDTSYNRLTVTLWHELTYPQVSTTIQSANNSVDIEDDGWYYVGFSWDGTTNANGLKIFFDTNVIIQGAATLPTLDTTPSVRLSIGAFYNLSPPGGSSWIYSSQELKGNIDQVKIWDIAFDTADFMQDKSIMDASLNPNYSNLINYYDFENSQITGTTVLDQTGSHNLSLMAGAVNSPLVP